MEYMKKDNRLHTNLAICLTHFFYSILRNSEIQGRIIKNMYDTNLMIQNIKIGYNWRSNRVTNEILNFCSRFKIAIGNVDLIHKKIMSISPIRDSIRRCIVMHHFYTTKDITSQIFFKGVSHVFDVIFRCFYVLNVFDSSFVYLYLRENIVPVFKSNAHIEQYITEKS